MADVAVFLSNPGHHVAMLAPVVEYLAARGVESRVHSLCELRGFELPEQPFASSGSAIARAWPQVLYRPRATTTASPATDGWRRRMARATAWATILRPRLERQLDRKARVAMLPNDSAFPYDRIASLLHRRRISYVVAQEGIRFPLPSEGVSRYGLSGARALAVWGEASAQHFLKAGVSPDRIHVTGCPRFDGKQRAIWPIERTVAPNRLDLLLITNPIDAQGFCSNEEKTALLAQTAHHLREHLASGSVTLTVRTHPGETVDEYRRALGRQERELVAFDTNSSLGASLGRCGVALTMASTVGLEALLEGVPLAVLPIPGHGFVHDYVDRGVAHGITFDDALVEQLSPLLIPDDTRSKAVNGYLRSHLANAGQATERLGELMIALIHDD